MKKQLWLLVLVSAVLLSAAPVLADDFYVIAAGPTAVGTKITSLPYTISSPGFYYLTGNLSYAGASGGIAISSDDVTLDLMGFRLSGPGSNGSNIGIFMSGRQNVEIRNGTLSGWWVGVYEAGNGARALNLRVENSVVGISFNGGQCLVKGCTVEATPGGTGTGIYLQGGTASGNIVSNSGVGIVLGGTGGNVIGNSVVIPSGSTGIRIDTNDPVLVDQNTVSGTVSGAGTRFSPGTGTVKTANNAGF